MQNTDSAYQNPQKSESHHVNVWIVLSHKILERFPPYLSLFQGEVGITPAAAAAAAAAVVANDVEDEEARIAELSEWLERVTVSALGVMCVRDSNNNSECQQQ